MSGEFGNASPNPLSLNAPSTSAPVERAPIKTKITLRPPAQPPTPFYTMKPKLPQPSELLGSMDLLSVYDLSNSYNKFCSPQGMKRIAKEDLSSFLPHLYGEFNWQRGQEISWLKMLIEKPPITGKEIVPLNSSAMASFKLQPGIVDEPYRSLFDTGYEVKDGGQKDTKKEKRKLKMSIDPLEEDCIDNWAMDGNAPDMGSDEEGGTKKKKKKSDKDREERKERKKEKKEKKEKKKKEKEHN